MNYCKIKRDFLSPHLEEGISFVVDLIFLNFRRTLTQSIYSFQQF